MKKSLVNFATKLSICFVFLFSSFPVYAGETSSGGAGIDSADSAKDEKPGDVVKADNCPTALKAWVKDDYQDKRNWFGVPFPSEAKTCTSYIQSYKNYISKAGQKSSLADAEEFSNYLAGRYKQVAPSAKASLSRCNALPTGQDRIAKTRYYMAMEKFENYNTSIVDEIAYIDSMDPKSSGLSKIECNPQFPFPKQAQRCNDYKTKINGTCKTTPEQRMDGLVSKTYQALEQVDKLEKAYNKCVREIHFEKCAPIKVVLSRIAAENPWIESSQFKQVRGSMRYKGGWARNYNRDDFKKRISGYFGETRDVLVKQYNSNMKHVRCMSYTTTESSGDCKFENTRELLTNIPDVPNLEDRKLQKNREFDSYVEAEKCLIDRGLDRENTRKIVTDSGTSAVITVATAGLSVIGAGGLKVMQGMSPVNKMRSAAGAVTAAAAANLYGGVKEAVNSCGKEAEATLKFSDSPEAMNDNICPDISSKMQLAKDAESSCMMDALLASADVWPFTKGLGMVGRQFSKQGLLDLYKDPKERAAIEDILKKNGRLTDPEREAAAEKLLGKLSPSQKSCVTSAHNIAPSRYMKTAESEALGVPLLTNEDLLKKKSTLLGCGFSVPDVALLLRSGITGSSVEAAASDYIRKASYVGLNGKKLNDAQVQAIWDVSTMKASDASEILKKTGGFSDDEINFIANRKLNNVSPEQMKAVKPSDLTAEAKPLNVETPVKSVPNNAPRTDTASAKFISSFDRGETEIIKAFQESRSEIKGILSRTDSSNFSVDQVADFATRGLTPKEAVPLLKNVSQNEASYKNALKTIDSKVAELQKSSAMQADYSAAQLQELKTELMVDFYEKKYKKDFFDIDLDELDPAGYASYSKAQEQLTVLKKKKKKWWPGQ